MMYFFKRQAGRCCNDADQAMRWVARHDQLMQAFPGADAHCGRIQRRRLLQQRLLPPFERFSLMAGNAITVITGGFASVGDRCTTQCVLRSVANDGDILEGQAAKVTLLRRVRAKKNAAQMRGVLVSA